MDKNLLAKLEALLMAYELELNEQSTIGDLIDYVEDISKKDDGVLFKIYNKHFQDQDGSRKRLILSTMHKAKGLEFENVIVQPSYLKLGEQKDFNEYLAEEKGCYMSPRLEQKTAFLFISGNVSWLLKRELLGVCSRILDFQCNQILRTFILLHLLCKGFRNS